MIKKFLEIMKFMEIFKNLRKYLSFLISTYFLISFNFSSVFADPGTHPDFGGIEKRISIQQGTAISAWLDRGDVAKSSAMTPVGDGTWEITVDLVPNATYNFMFFAHTGDTPPTGLSQNSDYYDTPPTNYSGKITFPTSTSSTTIAGSQTAYFGKAGSGDDRRLVYIPSGGTTFYVFANFSHDPNPPNSFNANPSGGTHITLDWIYPKDHWNSTVQADVVAGGKYFIYRSSDSPAGPFSLIASTWGAATQHKDMGLTTGVTYYYVIVSSDAYRGTTRIGKVNQQGIDDNFVMSFPDLAQDAARPSFAVPVIFKVENEKYKIDGVDYAKIGDNALVYLTPWTEDGRYYPCKIKGRITSVYLP